MNNKMMKKLISITLIAAAALMTVAIPSAHGGPYSSYNTTWKITCAGVPGLNILGQLNLTTKQGVLSVPAGCSSIDGTTLNDTDTGTNPVNTSTAPSSWTWTSPGCFNLHGKPIISGKFGQWVPYNCFSTVLNSNGFYDLISVGSVMVSKPVGQ